MKSEIRKSAIAVAAILFFSIPAFSQTKYPSVQNQNTMTSTQTMVISGKFKVGQETRLLEEVYLEKLKDLSLSATQDRLVLIDKFGQLKAGGEWTPPGQGGGNGGGGNQNSCAGAVFEWKKVSGTSNIYNCGGGKVGIGTTEPKEKLQIGNTFTFHDGGGNKAIARNFYWDGSTSRRIELGKATSIAFGDTGTISLRVASDGVAESEIDWRYALTVFNSGRVGIGTINTGSKLVVQGSASDASASSLNVRNSNNNSLFFVRDDGKIGIGTTEPKEKLQIGNTFTFHDGGGNKVIARNFYWDGSTSRRIELGKATSIAFGDTGTISLRVAPPGVANSEIEWTNALNITNNGNVGIGTDPQAKLHVKGQTIIGSQNVISGSHINYKLAVDGKLVAREFYTISSGWGDHVFRSDYDLWALRKVDEYLEKNGHLNGFPNAQYFEKNGINLGDVTVLQQIKIEEIFLYLIQQDKKIEELQLKIKTLEEKSK